MKLHNLNQCSHALCSTKQMYMFTAGATAKPGSSFGSSPSLDFFLDDVKCFGEEEKLLECHSSPVLLHNCLHTEEAGVTCHGGLIGLDVLTPLTINAPSNSVMPHFQVYCTLGEEGQDTCL